MFCIGTIITFMIFFQDKFCLGQIVTLLFLHVYINIQINIFTRILCYIYLRLFLQLALHFFTVCFCGRCSKSMFDHPQHFGRI